MHSRSLLLAAAVILAGAAGAAQAADQGKPNAGTTKGAAVGALAGHEVGSGHAVAGAATGAGIGHHQEKKSEEHQSSKK